MSKNYKELLRDSQVEFYESSYGIIISIVELAYQELVLCADKEGIQFMRSRLNQLGREAKINIRKIHSDIL